MQQATDALAAKLLGIALDDGASEAVRLAAIRDALDRGGLGAKTAVSVEVGTPAYVEVFDGIYNGPRFDPPADGTHQTQLEPAPEGPFASRRNRDAARVWTTRSVNRKQYSDERSFSGPRDDPHSLVDGHPGAVGAQLSAMAVADRRE